MSTTGTLLPTPMCLRCGRYPAAQTHACTTPPPPMTYSVASPAIAPAVGSEEGDYDQSVL